MTKPGPKSKGLEHRKVVMLTEEDAKRLREESERLGISESALLRYAWRTSSPLGVAAGDEVAYEAQEDGSLQRKTKED